MRHRLTIEENERLMIYERLAAFDAFSRKLGQEIEKQGLSEEQLLNDFEKTKQEVAEARYSRNG
jgi:hypothetical protein